MPLGQPLSTTLTTRHMAKKLLVANRGEIAVRVIRAAHELGLRTVAIYSQEDRLSVHRGKADEAYQIAPLGECTPVGAYLDQDRILHIAREHDVDLIHPGYGFLSENADFARGCEEAGIRWVGPQPDVIAQVGDKTRARQLAIDCGVPVIPGSKGPLETVEELKEFCDEYGFPVIVKAAMGGGGRGMRILKDPSQLAEVFYMAKREAQASFGDATVFAERYLDRPRHIEVQLLGDGTGAVVHLWDRDCSVQRRYQKVVEMAPATSIPESVRKAMQDDAIKLGKAVKYRNAGTVEFLVDRHNRHYFIEINPRIQVEHTVTEEVTGLDIVAMQIQIACGIKLRDFGLASQADVPQPRSVAIQCRITTEDPSKNFQPDTGKIEVYRSAGGPGVRLDGGSGFTGSIIQPYYDSLLVKMTCTARSFETCRDRMQRALVEFRIRGVKTNIGFLLRVLDHPVFRRRECWTTWVDDDTRELTAAVRSLNRAQKMLSYLADLAVNGSSIKGQAPDVEYHAYIHPPALEERKSADGSYSEILNMQTPCRTGWRNILIEKGPKAFAKAVREHPGCLITDTTWRDAHQSLLATRLRTYDMARAAIPTSHALASAFSIEMWGGATFDVCLRFLHECPWDRLRQLRKLVPNIPFQMLLRGSNAVGYTSYPDNVVYAFCKKAKECGVDVFRVFDSLNYLENLSFGIKAVLAAGGVVEAAICYTGDVSDPKKTKYSLDYFVNLADQLVQLGTHIIGIKDMAGLLKPSAARMLVAAIRERHPTVPIHVHTHDTAGTGVASMLAAVEAGADIVDTAVDSFSGMTSQPSMGAIVGALAGSKLDTGILFQDVQTLNHYWEQVRLLYACFDPGLKSGDSGVYEHEMPGGQYTNLLFQSRSLGLGDQWIDVKKAYVEANLLCGDIVKVTPSSKVVGDLAQFMVSNKLNAQEVRDRARTLSFPTSVVEYFQGYLGQPLGGFPEPLRSDIIKNLTRIDGRPGEKLAPMDLDDLQTQLVSKYGTSITEHDVLSAALYPKVFEEFKAFQDKYGDLSMLPTQFFLFKPRIEEEIQVDIDQGKRLILRLLAIGPVRASGKRDVFLELNGEPRTLEVSDSHAAIEHVERERANPNDPGQVAAPMAGVVVELRVKEGVHVNDGDPLCVLSAMKMETIVSSPISGKVQKVAVNVNDSISAGDLVMRIGRD